ncbi:MAG: diguanylate cyclase [Spirochaetaceae bacterium]
MLANNRGPEKGRRPLGGRVRRTVRLTIRRKFAIAFSLLVLLPAVALGLVTIQVVGRSMVDQAEREQLLLLRAMKSKVVDRHIQDMEKAVRALAREPQLPEIFDDPEARRRVLSRWELTRTLFPERSYIYFGSKDNRIIVSPDWEPPQGYDCRVRPWYRAAQYAYDVVWVDPYEEYVTSDLVMSAAMPVYREGNFQGVLSIDTHLNGFFRLLKQDAGTRSSQLIAVTDRGRTLMLNETEGVRFDLAAHPQWEEISRLHDGGSYLDYEGERYYASVVDVPELRLTMVALLPTELLYQEIRPMLLAVVVVTAAFGVISLVAAYYFSRHFIVNIEKLNRYMYAVESGDYRIQHCVSGWDEFRELNGRLNTMVHHLSQSIETLETRSNTDALCGIANRRYITEQLREQCEHAAENSSVVSVVLMDLDHFKIINDTYGHAVGDEVLRRVARIMRDAFPRESVVGRFGGEEFMVILPERECRTALDIADRFRASLETQAWREPGLEITVSGGVAEWSRRDTPDTLTHRADRALYRAKSQGRNRILTGESVPDR